MIHFYQRVKLLFDEDATVRRAAEIGQAILKARSVRLTGIAAQMNGGPRPITSGSRYNRIGTWQKGSSKPVWVMTNIKGAMHRLYAPRYRCLPV